MATVARHGGGGGMVGLAVPCGANGEKWVTIATQNEHELKAPAQNNRNRTIWFGKPNYPVLSRPTAVRGTIGLR
jgi:hypothetical protein